MRFLRTLWRLLRRPRSLGRQCRLLFGYLFFRVRYGFLHSQVLKNLRTSEDTVFIVNFSDTPHRAITEGMLVKGFQEHGVTPVVVTSSASSWSRRYFRALGIDHFLFFDQWMQRAAQENDEATIRTFLASRPPLTELLGYRFEGVPIGMNALSTVLKRVRQGSIDLADPAMEREIHRTLLDAATAVRGALLLLAEHRPRALLFNEAGYTPYGELFAAAVQDGRNAVQYVHSQRLEAFTLKRYHSVENMIDPVSLSRQSWERVRSMPWSMEAEETFMRELRQHYEDGTWFDLLRDTNKRHLSPDAVRTELRLDPAKKTAVVFSHVAWDASFFFGKNLFRDYDHWLVETVKVACRNSAVNWVIKLHPDYVWHTQGMEHNAEMRDMIAVRADVGSLPPHVTVVAPDTDISTYSFFGVTDYCVTVRGTIGLECPCFGIPVFTAGTGRYSGLGFTEDFATAGEYLSAMGRIHETPPLKPERRSLARKHAFALFTLRPIPCPSFTLVPMRRSGQVIDHTVRIRARSRAEVESDPGLARIAEWVLESRDEDYLAL